MIRQPSRRSLRHSVAGGALGLALGLTLGLAAVDRPAAWAQEDLPMEESDAVVSGVNGFGLAVFDRLREESPGETVLLSPYSLGTALAMVAQGARGSNQAALDAALGTTDMSREEVAAAHAGLIEALTQQDVGITLTIANGLWVQDGFPVEPAFVAALHGGFGAEPMRIDFGAPGATDRINGWIAAETEGLIDKLLAELPDLTRLVLVNALYFKGLWGIPFDPEETRPAPFAVAGAAGPVEVPMMRRTDRIAYAAEDDFAAVRLPFGDGGMEMVLALPSDPMAEPTPEDLERWLLTPRFRPSQGTLELPRLALDWSGGLTETLQALGLADLFEIASADLSGIAGAPGDLKIDSVLQRAVMTLDEEGAEAAAATGVIVTTRAMPQAPFHLVFDRPFYLALRDAATGTVLFLGHVADPGTGSDRI